MNVIVIGGGASGLMAAITAAKGGKPVWAASCYPPAMAAATSPT